MEDINILLKDAAQLLDATRLLMKSVDFTTRMIDKLDLTEEKMEDFEYRLNNQDKLESAAVLMGRLKVDYDELKKMDVIYERLRGKINPLMGYECLKPLDITDDLDFGME